MKNVAYKLVTSDSLEQFQDDVQFWLQEGWALQGGVGVCRDSRDGETTFAQAMILEECNS